MSILWDFFFGKTENNHNSINKDKYNQDIIDNVKRLYDNQEVHFTISCESVKCNDIYKDGEWYLNIFEKNTNKSFRGNQIDWYRIQVTSHEDIPNIFRKLEY